MDEALRKELVAILSNEGKLAAVAALRSRTGAGLGEAKTIVDELATPAAAASAAPRSAVGLDEKLQSELRVILRRDGKLFATRTLRERTGMSLNDALAVLSRLETAPNLSALPAELLDHAAQFVLNSPSADERVDIDKQAVKRWGEAPWEAALARARRLEQQGSDLCDRSRDGDIAPDEVKPRLRKLSPGFSDTSYALAFERGMQATR